MSRLPALGTRSSSAINQPSVLIMTHAFSKPQPSYMGWRCQVKETSRLQLAAPGSAFSWALIYARLVKLSWTPRQESSQLDLQDLWMRYFTMPTRLCWWARLREIKSTVSKCDCYKTIAVWPFWRYTALFHATRAPEFIWTEGFLVNAECLHVLRNG